MAPRDQVMADLAHLFAVALRTYRPAEVAAARAVLPLPASAAAGLQLGHLAESVQVGPGLASLLTLAL